MIRNIIFKLFFVLFLTFPMFIVNAQNFISNSELIKEYEDLIVKRMESDNIIGVSAAILINDSVIWKKGFGYADKEN